LFSFLEFASFEVLVAEVAQGCHGGVIAMQRQGAG
jgi:hypothetical protein